MQGLVLVVITEATALMSNLIIVHRLMSTSGIIIAIVILSQDIILPITIALIALTLRFTPLTIAIAGIRVGKNLPLLPQDVSQF